MGQRTLKFIFITLTSLFPFYLWAQTDTTAVQKTKEIAEKLIEKPVPFFGGIAVSADLVGLAMKAMNNDYAQMEVSARINLKQKYYPVVEIGYGSCDYTSNETGNSFKTNAPYFRIGMDYNFLKKKNTGNRLYGGLRYAFTSFTYDIADPNFKDPVWGTPLPFNITGLKGNNHWVEFVFGVETRIWKFFHLGWSVRYKSRIKQNKSESGEPWYVPGFGKNETTGLGGTFNVIFDI